MKNCARTIFYYFQNLNKLQCREFFYPYFYQFQFALFMQRIVMVSFRVRNLQLQAATPLMYLVIVQGPAMIFSIWN